MSTTIPPLQPLRETLDHYLPKSSEHFTVFPQSNALANLVATAVKSIPYAFLAKNLGINDVSHWLSSRVAFIETTLLAYVSAITNLAFALIYTGLAIVTLGLSESINFSMRKHWSHMSYSFASAGIGLAGIMSPYAGTGLTFKFLETIFNSVKRNYNHDIHFFERKLLEKLQEYTRDYSRIVYKYVKVKVNNDAKYLEVFEPALIYCERKIHEAQRIDDLFRLVLYVRDEWGPRGLQEAVLPNVTSQEELGAKAVHSHYNHDESN